MSLCPPSPTEYAQMERTLSHWTGRNADVRAALLTLWAAQKRAFEGQYPDVSGQISETYAARPGGPGRTFEVVEMVQSCEYNTLPRGAASLWGETDKLALWTLIGVMLERQNQRRQQRAEWNAGKTPLQPRFTMPPLFG